MSRFRPQRQEDDENEMYDFAQDIQPDDANTMLQRQLEAALEAQQDSNEQMLNDLVPEDLNDLEGAYLPNNLKKIDEDENDIYGSVNQSGAKFLSQNKSQGSLKKPAKTKTFDDKKSTGSKNIPEPKPKKKPKHVITGAIGAKTDMTAVGSAQDAKQKLLAQNNNQMNKLLGTEYIIEKVLKMLDTDPWDDLGNWPPDAFIYKGMQLSNSRMINEVANREPRTIGIDGKVTEFSVIGTNLGYHSTNVRDRKSDIESLGEGNNLYFKFLKYFMLLFAICACISGPQIAANSNGVEFQKYETNNFAAWIARTFLGNIGSYLDLTCVSGNLPNTKNKASYINFKCPKGKSVTELKHFGLAYQNQTCTGKGINQSVDTIDRCTMGSMENTDLEKNLKARFIKDCIGQNVCSMLVEYETVFTVECINEIIRRNEGQLFYGPPKAYAIASCENDSVSLGNGIELTREDASLVIVILDWLIMFFLAICIIRLKWYEEVSVVDMKNGKLKVEDFSVFLPEIPIHQSEYNNNPDLLTAQLATHLEEIVEHELQVIPELKEIQENQGKVVSIHYGLSSQTTMIYLVEIFKQCEKIADLRKKILVDPPNTRVYEAQQWIHYTEVTRLNDLYYAEKNVIKPEIINAYVTFRSMESKVRAIQGYDLNWFQTQIATKCCGLDQFFKKKRLVQEGDMKIKDVVDPQIVLWENVGVSQNQKMKNRVLTAVVMFFCLMISYTGHYYFQRIAKELKSFEKSECAGSDWVTIDHAYIDYLQPKQYKLGNMNCYCRQILKVYGVKGLGIIFEDGEKYCQTWYDAQSQSEWQTTALGSWIAFTNIIFTVIFQMIGKSKRGKNTAENDASITWNIFLISYINTTMLILLAQNSFFASYEKIDRNDKANIFVGVYDDFTTEWYLFIGLPIFASQCAMLVFPHIFTLMQAMMLCFIRCVDRRFSLNTRKTSKIIQDDYENLYTGPAFILQVRYAQVLFTIFVTITFSSGMPVLYIVNFLVLFVQFWVDKFLVFNYYRKTTEFTKQLSTSVVSLLPVAVILHFIIATYMYGYPLILRSQSIGNWIGLNEKYHTKERMSQKHMVIYTCLYLAILLIMIFQSNLIPLWRCIARAFERQCGMCCARINGREYDDTDYSKAGFVYSDDLYSEYNFGKVYKLYKQTKKDQQRYKLQKHKKMYDQKQINNYIDPYLELLARNEANLLERCMELVELHTEALMKFNEDYENMSDEQKIDALHDLYDKATNKHNADRDKYLPHIDQNEMKGKVMNEICSYDLMDNEKYQRIEYLLSVMKETFGFDNIELEDPDVEINKKEHLKEKGDASKNQSENRQNTQSDFGIFSRNGTGALNKQNQL